MAEGAMGDDARKVCDAPTAAFEPDRSKNSEEDCASDRVEDSAEMERSDNHAGAEEQEDRSGEGDEDEEEGLELPEKMRKSVEIIHHISGETGLESTVYLVGTAHISKESCDLVEAVIKLVKPDAVFLELCRERCSLLLDLEPTKGVPTVKQMLESWRSNKINAFGVVYSYFLAKAAQRLEVSPGGEFRRAYETGRACNALVILGDRPVSISLKRAAASLTMWQKIKLGCSILWSIIYLPAAEELDKMLTELTDTDEFVQLLQDYCKNFPSLLDALLTERDLFMTSMLRGACSKYRSIVAVVGKGHVSGIIANWTKPPIEVSTLLEVPEKKPWGSRWRNGLCLVGIGISVYIGKRWMP